MSLGPWVPRCAREPLAPQATSELRHTLSSGMDQLPVATPLRPAREERGRGASNEMAETYRDHCSGVGPMVTIPPAPPEPPIVPGHREPARTARPGAVELSRCPLRNRQAPATLGVASDDLAQPVRPRGTEPISGHRVAHSQPRVAERRARPIVLICLGDLMPALAPGSSQVPRVVDRHHTPTSPPRLSSPGVGEWQKARLSDASAIDGHAYRVPGTHLLDGPPERRDGPVIYGPSFRSRSCRSYSQCAPAE